MLANTDVLTRNLAVCAKNTRERDYLSRVLGCEELTRTDAVLNFLTLLHLKQFPRLVNVNLTMVLKLDSLFCDR